MRTKDDEREFKKTDKQRRSEERERFMTQTISTTSGQSWPPNGGRVQPEEYECLGIGCQSCDPHVEIRSEI